MDGEFVALSSEKPGILKATSGKCTYNINCMSPEGYPRPIMPFPEENAIISGICSLTKRTTFAAGKDESKQSLQCVSVKIKNNAVHAAACNGFALILVKGEAESPCYQEFLIPSRSLSVLASVSSDSDVFEVGDMGNHIVFMRGDMMFTINKLVMNTSDYPDILKMIKKIEPAYTAVANANEIREALNIIAVGAMSEGSNGVIKLSLTDGQITLRSVGDVCKGRSALPATTSKSIPNSSFFYQISPLLKFFHSVQGRVRLEIDTKGIILIKAHNEVYLQVAMQRGNHKAIEQTSAKGAKVMKESQEPTESTEPHEEAA